MRVDGRVIVVLLQIGFVSLLGFGVEDGPPNVRLAMFLGVLFGQAALLGFAAGIVLLTLPQRCGLVLIGVGYLSLQLVLSLEDTPALVALCLASLIPLNALTVFPGRSRWRALCGLPASPQPSQFQLWHLFLLTTAVAASIVLVRGLPAGQVGWRLWSFVVVLTLNSWIPLLASRLLGSSGSLRYLAVAFGATLLGWLFTTWGGFLDSGLWIGLLVVQATYILVNLQLSRWLIGMSSFTIPPSRLLLPTPHGTTERIPDDPRTVNTMNFLDQLTGSFAQPAAENPTVAMIEAAYRHHRLPWRYINCEVAPRDLAAAVAGAKAMGFAGFNCSLPHKVEVIRYLDGLGDSAKLMGAVNCVVRRNGQWIGENTDGKGFLKSLREVTDPAGKRIVLLGAGGAARAIAVELALAGAAQLTIVNRNPERGQALASLLNEQTATRADYATWDQAYHVPVGSEIVVNATSVGLYPDIDARLNLNTHSLTPSMIVADVIPNPLQTRLIQDAERIGCIVLDGLGMLVNQGVISIKYWTGVDVDPSVMRNEIIDVLQLNRGEI